MVVAAVPKFGGLEVRQFCLRAASRARPCSFASACRRSIAPANSAGRTDRTRVAGVTMSRRAAWDRSARPPQTNVSRVAPLNRSHPATAIVRRPCRPSGTWVPTAGREVDSRRPPPGAAGRCCTGSLRSGRRAASSSVTKRTSRARSSQTTRLASRFGLGESPASVTSRAEIDRGRRRRRGGSWSVRTDRTCGRTPPTGCAARCAAACDRTGAPSRSRPRTRSPGTSGPSSRAG